jgi:hypothetical protein
MEDKKMIDQKGWEEFQSTVLLLFINQILHVFGWAIVLQYEGDKVVSCYPARCKFRGFSEDHVSESYVKISKYLKDNAATLDQEANED